MRHLCSATVGEFGKSVASRKIWSNCSIDKAARDLNATVMRVLCEIIPHLSVTLHYVLLIHVVCNESDRLDINTALLLLLLLLPGDVSRLERTTPDYTLVCVSVNGASESGPSLRVRALHSCFSFPSLSTIAASSHPLGAAQALIGRRTERTAPASSSTHTSVSQSQYTLLQDGYTLRPESAFHSCSCK